MNATAASDGWLRLLLDGHVARRRGSAAILQRQHARLVEIIAYARKHSPYYRELYRDLPERVEDVSTLPITDKKKLMARFDDWCTDREVTMEKVRAFAENPDAVGQRFLGKYVVATTSGTTGTPGMFVMDDQALCVTNVIMLRWLFDWLGFGDVLKFLARDRRMAMTIAPGGHSATAVAAGRMLTSESRRKRIRAYSVHTPLSELVEQLNEFQPAVLAPYASIAKLLASEQKAGRLHINPVMVALAAEGLPIEEYDRIAKTLKTKVSNSYAATECMFLSYGCEQRWLHVNADWVVLEPVDAEHRPVAAGEQSHTVLLSNLANRVQPILRYDLGDSVVMRRDACLCGNPLPAIRVKGRSADVLTFSTQGGESVSIPPLAFDVDHVPGVELFQIVQRTPTVLRVRIMLADGTDLNRVWHEIHAELSGLLAKHRLGHVLIELADEPPKKSRGGKFRAVIPFGAATDGER